MIASIPLGVFLVIVLFFVAMAAVVVTAGATARRRAALVKATPTSAVGMAADGYREFEGTSDAVSGPPVTAHFTGWPCVWYHAKLEQYRLGKNTRTGASWHTVGDWTSGAPFFIRDATGVAIFDPFRGEITATDKSEWLGKTEQPADRTPKKFKPTESVHGGFQMAVTGDYRYSEERIYAGDPLLVLGEFKTHTFDPADDDDEDDAGEAEADPDEKRDAALLAEAQKVTRATIGRGSGKQPLIITTTPQAQHIAMSEKGGMAAYAIALVPLGIALWLLWARFG
jgi:hypothetical protein